LCKAEPCSEKIFDQYPHKSTISNISSLKHILEEYRYMKSIADLKETEGKILFGKTAVT